MKKTTEPNKDELREDELARLNQSRQAATEDMSRKKDGVTSAFSAATSVNYSGEDVSDTATDTGNDMDKMRSGRQENEDESKL